MLSHCNCLTTDFLKPPAGHFSRLAYNIISRFVQSRGTWYVGNVREDIHLVVPTPRREGRSGLYSKKDYKKEKRSRINLSWCKFYHGHNIFYIQLLFSFWQFILWCHIIRNQIKWAMEWKWTNVNVLKTSPESLFRSKEWHCELEESKNLRSNPLSLGNGQ